ncbi:MAG: YceI family protein [Pseudomonadota bacterium]
MIRRAAPALALALLLAAVAAPALAGGWAVDSAASAFAFVSVKNGEIAEAHSFGELTGEVHEDGAAEVRLGLGSVETGIEIRNARMREMLFQVADHPLAMIHADIDLAAYDAMAVGERRMEVREIAVAANGEQAFYMAHLAITRIGEDRVAVSSALPILVEASDFGYGAGLEALRAVAGLDSISPAVPVTFDLVLAR